VQDTKFPDIFGDLAAAIPIAPGTRNGLIFEMSDLKIGLLHQFLLGIPRQLAKSGIGGQPLPAIGRLLQDTNAGVIKNRSEQFLVSAECFFGVFALCNVASRTSVADKGAIFIVDRLATDREVNTIPIVIVMGKDTVAEGPACGEILQSLAPLL